MSDSESDARVSISGHNLSRSYSDKFLIGSGELDLILNNNANWVQGSFFKISYIFGVILFYLFFHVSLMMSNGDCWTATNMIHGMVN